MSILIGIILILIFIIILLFMYTHIIYTSLKEIIRELNFIFLHQTNHLITTSFSNKKIKKIIKTLNDYIKCYKKQEREYIRGNIALNNAITNISHDLRTPLTVIRGYTNLLKEKIINGKEREYVKIIDDKCEELSLLMEELFTMTKASNLKENINKEEICLNDLLENVLVNYYTILKQKHIEVDIEICQKKVIRFLDKNSIIRVLENIISNSVKYSQKDLKVSLTEEGIIIFSNKTNKMDYTMLNKLFERYYTVENGKMNSGLGLAIAKELVELNHGKIQASYQNSRLEIKIIFKS